MAVMDSFYGFNLYDDAPFNNKVHPKVRAKVLTTKFDRNDNLLFNVKALLAKN